MSYYSNESSIEQNIRAVGEIVDKFQRNNPHGGTIKIEVDRYGHIACSATSQPRFIPTVRELSDTNDMIQALNDRAGRLP